MPNPKPSLNVRESHKAASPRSSQEHAVLEFCADYKRRARSSSGSTLKNLAGMSATSALATLEDYSAFEDHAASKVMRPSKNPKKRGPA